MNIPLADYEIPQSLFTQLLQPDADRRILMFQGESGSGKSRLLEWCIVQTPPHVPYVSVQLRGNDTSTSSLFYRLGRRAGWKRLPNFTHRIATMLNTPHAFLDQNWQVDMRQHLQLVLHPEDINYRRQRHAILTDAWFEDAKMFTSPFLLVLDTYEQASTELDHWFRQQFLPLIGDAQAVRVLVAGQELPELSNDWRHCCHQLELSGVLEAQAWLPVAQAMGRQVQSFDFLAGVCAAFDGNPSQILAFIQTLKRQEVSTPALHSETPLFRATLRRKIVDHFDELDVRELCFDFNINYEGLGQSHNLRDKIIALIQFMEKHGRMPELVRRCQELRPHLEW